MFNFKFLREVCLGGLKKKKSSWSAQIKTQREEIVRRVKRKKGGDEECLIKVLTREEKNKKQHIGNLELN